MYQLDHPFCEPLDRNTSLNHTVTLVSLPLLDSSAMVNLVTFYSNINHTVSQVNCCRDTTLGEVAMETVCITVMALLLLSLIGILIITILEARRVRNHYSKENYVIDDDIYVELDDLDETTMQSINDEQDEATKKSINEIKNLYDQIPDNYVINALRILPDYTDPPDVIEEEVQEDEEVSRIMNLLFVEPIRNSQAPPSPIPCTLPGLMEEEPTVNNWKTIRKQLRKIRNMKVGSDERRGSLADNEARLSWRETILQEVNRRASELEDGSRVNSFSLCEKRNPSVTFSDREKRNPSVTFSCASGKHSPSVTFNQNKKRNSSVISGLSTFSRDSHNSKSSCRNSSITSDGSTDCEHSLDYLGTIMEQKSIRRSLKRKKGSKVSPKGRNSSSSSLYGKNVCLSPKLDHKGAERRRAGGIIKLPPSNGNIMKMSASNGALINYKKKRRQGVSFSENDHHPSYNLTVISKHPNVNKTSTEV